MYGHIHTNTIMKNIKTGTLFLCCAALLATATPSEACTGISLKSKDGSIVLARTCEWGGSNLESR